MSKEFLAESSVVINAPCTKVWEALLDAKIIKQYMFGVEAVSDWKKDCPIIWTGIWKGKPYEDKGVIVKIERHETLSYTHFSPLEGLPDVPENYHTVTYKLSDQGSRTILFISQDNNKNAVAVEKSNAMWEKMLGELKNLLEKEHVAIEETF